jgi:hypothetical protein
MNDLRNGPLLPLIFRYGSFDGCFPATDPQERPIVHVYD